MSANYDNTPHEIGWDDEIASESSYILLEEGDYDFTVTHFERGRFPGSNKIPACNKAMLTLSVETPAGKADVRYDLILWSALEWKLSEFLRAIGQKKRGEPTHPRWNEMLGATGRARFKQRTYTRKDGTEGRTNDVAKFYDYDPSLSPPATGVLTDLPQSTPTPWDADKF